MSIVGPQPHEPEYDDLDEEGGGSECDFENLDSASREAVSLSELMKSFDGDCKSLALHYIKKFFEDKQLDGGGPIPNHFLTAESYLKMVLNWDVCRGVDEAYERMGFSGEVSDVADESNVSPDTRLLVDIHKQCKQMGIPKCFVAGITVMYLELCLGYKVRSRLKDFF